MSLPFCLSTRVCRASQKSGGMKLLSKRWMSDRKLSFKDRVKKAEAKEAKIDAGAILMLVRCSTSCKTFISLINPVVQAIPVTTFGLGVWQTKRKAWKEALITELEHKTRRPPIDIPNE